MDAEQDEEASEGKRKRSRADRSEKLKRRKVTVETVVKASLLKHLQGDQKQRLRDAIQERVAVFSQRYHLGSLALSGMLKHCFDGVEDVTAARLPDLTRQSFFRQLMLGTQDAVKPDPHVQAYYRDHAPQLAFKLPTQRHQGDRNIYSAGAKKYMTNLRNHLVVGFKPRLFRFLHAFQRANGLTDEQRTWTLFRTCGWAVPKDLEHVPQLPSMLAVVATHRRILGLTGVAAEVTPRWLDSKGTLHHLLRHAVHVCRYLEAQQRPTFNLVPIARRGAHYITIDTYVLYGLLKELSLVASSEAEFVAMGAEHWASTVAVHKLQGKDREFTGTVDSDGTSLCVHYRRNKKATEDVPVMSAKPKTRSLLAPEVESHTVLGMDPGRTNIYYFAMEQHGGASKSWKLTRRRYYADAGITAAKHQTEAWHRALQEPLRRLSDVTSKGTELPVHQRFLAVVLDTHDLLWSEYLKARWANQRLRLYGGKQRVFATFLKGVADGATAAGGCKPLVVAYGAAKFAPGSKGELSVPTSRAYKECVQRFRCVLVDEFRTTMVHAGDGSVLKQVWSKRKKAAVRGLMWCGSTNNGKFVDRDLNAALNIRRCLAASERPVELCRVAGQGRLPKVVGKRIRR